MSSHPNTYICAVLKFNTIDLLETLLNEDEYLDINGQTYCTASDESGMYVSEEDNTLTVYEYLTYGWGEALTLPEFQEQINKFTSNIQEWCLNNNSTISEIRIGADWF